MHPLPRHFEHILKLVQQIVSHFGPKENCELWYWGEVLGSCNMSTIGGKKNKARTSEATGSNKKTSTKKYPSAKQCEVIHILVMYTQIKSHMHTTQWMNTQEHAWWIEFYGFRYNSINFNTSCRNSWWS